MLTFHILSHLSHIFIFPGYSSSFFFVLIFLFNLFIVKNVGKKKKHVETYLEASLQTLDERQMSFHFAEKCLLIHIVSRRM